MELTAAFNTYDSAERPIGEVTSLTVLSKLTYLANFLD
jgi:hypothetical protein